MYEEMNEVAGWFMVALGVAILWWVGGLVIAAGCALVFAGYSLLTEEDDIENFDAEDDGVEGK